MGTNRPKDDPTRLTRAEAERFLDEWAAYLNAPGESGRPRWLEELIAPVRERALTSYEGGRVGAARLKDRVERCAAAAMEAVKALAREHRDEHFRGRRLLREKACERVRRGWRADSGAEWDRVKERYGIVWPVRAAGRREDPLPSLDTLMDWTKPLRDWTRDDRDREVDETTTDPDVLRCRSERKKRKKRTP